MSPTLTLHDATGVDVVIEACRRIVRKKRVRVSEFFIDFDRLRCGLVHPNHFISALSIAGIDKALLSAADIDTLKTKYTVKKDGVVDMIDYKSFCADLDKVEEDVSELFNQTFSRDGLTDAERENVNEMLFKIMQTCQQKGILVKPMFVDFANSNNSTKLVGHVTKQQFHRTLDCKIGIRLSEDDVNLLCAVYCNPDYKEMVNYVAFANDVLPDECPYDPYREA